jgi:hypothetical protein
MSNLNLIEQQNAEGLYTPREYERAVFHATYDSTGEWRQRAARSQRASLERRLHKTEDSVDRAWGRGFVFGLLAGVALAVAWFTPLLELAS